MISRKAPGWQLILADLALILFLVTLSALAGEASDGIDAEALDDTLAPPKPNPNVPQFAASQSLFRPSPLGPTLDEWLREQPADPRATLTIFARFAAGDKDAAWERAHTLTESAAKVLEEKEFSVRVVITQANISDVYASIAYDTLNDQSRQ